MLLLGHAREALRAGTITAEQLAAELNRARYGLAIYSGHLLHLTEARTWEELIAERARHRSANALVDLANDLVRITCSRFRELSGAGSRLVDEALRYHYAVGVFMEKAVQAGQRTAGFLHAHARAVPERRAPMYAGRTRCPPRTDGIRPREHLCIG